jgi:hypothetical protein
MTSHLGFSGITTAIPGFASLERSGSGNVMVITIANVTGGGGFLWHPGTFAG